MAQSIKNRVFGSDLPEDIKKKIRIRQKMSLANERMLEPHFDSDGIFEEVGYYHNFKDIGGNVDLSSRTPFVRMWTSIKFVEPASVEEALEFLGDADYDLDFFDLMKRFYLKLKIKSLCYRNTLIFLFLDQFYFQFF